MCEIKETTKTEKLKSVGKVVWEEVKLPLAIGGTFFAAFVLGGKYAIVCSASGLKSFHTAGVLKFFDPATGLEVSPEEALKVVDKIAAGLKA